MRSDEVRQKGEANKGCITLDNWSLFCLGTQG